MLSTILALLAAWTLWSLVALYRNYRIAKTTGLPIVIEPVSNLSPVWFMIDGFSKSIKWLRPFRDMFVRKFMPFSYLGWQFDLGYAVHAKYGPAFVHVSPGSISVSVGDPSAAYDVMSRRKDFIKPRFIYQHMDVFGPSVNTVEGEVWQRHRRLTGPSFNERVSSSAWNESQQSSQKMLDAWVQTGSGGVSTTVDDTADLALKVLTTVGFGQTAQENSGARSKNDISLHSTVQLILQNFVLGLMIPSRILSSAFMPESLRRLGNAHAQFRSYVADLLRRQRMQVDKEDRTSNNLLANLVRAADAEKNEKSSMGMTDAEIYGNLFIFTLAGHETTANAIATSIVYLARYPKYQQWIREEIRHVLGSNQSTSPNYETCFPQLKRCLAVMYETLRIHGSVVVIPRSTHSRPEMLTVQGKQHTIPPDTLIWVNNQAAQTDPAFWGPNAEQWLPDRWILLGTSKEESKGLDGEVLMQPANGAFMPWADGPRNCVGKKFSQVEFVAALATLFKDHLVEPAPGQSGHKHLNMNDQIDLMIKDSEFGPATLQFKHPKRVNMAWKAVSTTA